MRRLLLRVFIVTLAACVPAPPLPCTACDSVCTDLRFDSQNCGECGKACGTGEICAAGKCELTCTNNLRDCSGACVDTRNDPNHCGDCAHACTAAEYCSLGGCLPLNACVAPRQICGTDCVDTRFDPSHCGGCGNPCAAGMGCVDAGCVP